MMPAMLDIPWYVYALLGALFVSLTSVAEKKALIHDEPMHFSAASAALLGLLSIPFLFFVEWASIPPEAYVLMFGVTVVSTLAFCLVAYSMRRLDAGEQSLIIALTPAATAVLAFLFLGEVLSSRASAGLLLVIFGLIVLELPGVRAGFKGKEYHKKVAPLLASFAAVLTYAVGAIGDRLLLHTYGIRPIDFLAIVQVMGLAAFIPISLFLHHRKKLFTSSLMRQPAKLGAFAVLLFLSRLSYAEAVSMAYVALAAALKRSGALFTIVIARAYLGERGTAHKLLAAGIILTGIVCIIL